MFASDVLQADVVHYVLCFIFYSFLGWLVESLYMSFCNRKITNRGFAVSPFCPIYGFGAVVGNLVLQSLSGHLLLLYFAGAVLATIFEYLVAVIMNRLLGSVWWDYSEKPFNYKGVICLESTIAWGFYAIIVVEYLNGFMMKMVSVIPFHTGILITSTVILIYGIDFFYHFLDAVGLSGSYRNRVVKCKDIVVERYQRFRERW